MTISAGWNLRRFARGDDREAHHGCTQPVRIIRGDRDARLLRAGGSQACALGSIYGFLQGAWPFGLVEAVWAGVALRRWRFKQEAGA
jgi:hypothetical protein